MTFALAIAVVVSQAPVKFELASAEAPLIIVPVKVNGMAMHFILDTGASATLITNAAVKKLNLTVSGDVTAVGAGGAEAMKLTRCKSLSLGDAEVHDRELVVGDLKDVMEIAPGIDGVLGYDFLRAHVVTIDYPKLEVRLTKSAPRGK